MEKQKALSSLLSPPLFRSRFLQQTFPVSLIAQHGGCQLRNLSVTLLHLERGR